MLVCTRKSSGTKSKTFKLKPKVDQTRKKQQQKENKKAGQNWKTKRSEPQNWICSDTHTSAGNIFF